MAIPCKSTETQIWMSLTNKGRNTEMQGCALTRQFPKCYTSICQFSLEGEFQPPRRYRIRSKGSEADLSEDVLPFSLWEGVGQKWGHKEAHFESLPGPEELKTVNEGRVEEGWLLFFFQIFKIYLPLFYIFCLPNLLHDSDLLLVPDGRCEMGLTNTRHVRAMISERYEAQSGRLWWWCWPMNAWSS